MTDDELELAILKRFVDQYKVAEIKDEQSPNKCLRELSMMEVLRELTAQSDDDLKYATRHWYARLAPARLGDKLGPLRPCSDALRNTGEHRYHARAWFGRNNSGPADTWQRVRELERIIGTSASKHSQPMSTKKTTIRLFISHSSEDKDLAARLLELLHIALPVRPEEIRCTTIDGYRLKGGADTDDELRREVLDAQGFLGIVSANSMQSLYVLFEFGARWSAKRH